ncbi:MAG: hypothetical protein H6654_04280 [Ardenticatenaceae bacterium]|nr:hypothetical protein [Anaerolineales bacterium]MCB8941396.1 hypothetical protein [Ardenticatenaceae bacterium]MCB8972752.1 hypothetical protein [Ardenticatenaceae bacterium]
MKHVSFRHTLGLIMGMSFLLALLIGCTVSQPNSLENNSIIAEASLTVKATLAIPSLATLTSPATPFPNENVATTLTPASTQTATSPLLPSATSTNVSTLTPTLTPLPTFSPQERGLLFSELMISNGGCDLPCWWGFEMGKSSLDEVRQLYKAFGAHITQQSGDNGIIILEAQFVDPQTENGQQIRHSFVAQNNILIEAEVQLIKQPSYQIESILRRLGQPSEIWMSTIPEPYLEQLPADFLLYFSKLGVIAGYRTSGEKVNDTISVCFNNTGGGTLHLWDPNIWDPNNSKGIVERTNQASSIFNLDGYHPIEEVSNWDVESFYTMLSNDGHIECLETPSELWRPRY